MKFLIAFVMAVVVITYPVKIVIQNAESLATQARGIPFVQKHIEQIPETILPPIGIVSPEIRGEENKQIACLAKNIYFEAAVESTAGKLAVAHVTHNRVSSHHYPDSYCKVIYEGKHYASGFPKRDRCQFSWYCDGRHDNPFPGPTWSRVQDLANYYYANANDLRDITDGATHYHADYIDSPRWTTFKKKTVQIDTHIFYR
jgi:spore germination cell wall hydrolase CwlJ-like protein